jgi:hypothetical protein
MNANARVFKSKGSAFKYLVSALRAEGLKIEIHGKNQGVTVQVASDIQNFTISGYVGEYLLVFLIPGYLRIPKDLSDERLLRIFSEVLQLNDELGLVKFCFDKDDREIYLSAEIPWRELAFRPSTIPTYFDLLVYTASMNIGKMLSLVLPPIDRK